MATLVAETSAVLSKIWDMPFKAPQLTPTQSNDTIGLNLLLQIPGGVSELADEHDLGSCG